MPRRSLVVLILAAALMAGPLGAANASTHDRPLADRTSDFFDSVRDSTSEIVAAALDLMLSVRSGLGSEGSEADVSEPETTNETQPLPSGSAECQHEVDPWG